MQKLSPVLLEQTSCCGRFALVLQSLLPSPARSEPGCPRHVCATVRGAPGPKPRAQPRSGSRGWDEHQLSCHGGSVGAGSPTAWVWENLRVLVTVQLISSHGKFLGAAVPLCMCVFPYIYVAPWHLGNAWTPSAFFQTMSARSERPVRLISASQSTQGSWGRTVGVL